MIIRKQTNRAGPRPAFTLMEVLVVVAILVALAGVAAFFVLPQLGQSYERTARIRALELSKAVEAYYTDHGATYPNQLADLLVKDQLGGPYIQKASSLLDPWGNQYVYDQSGQKNIQAGNAPFPDIYCVNPNDQQGMPIGNW